jgi:excinuclease UvrABC nuclease subunit
MNTNNIDPLTLPSLPLKERSSLPSCSAIYFVMDGNCVLYIGKSVNLAQRWATHHKLSQLVKLDSVLKIAWLECSDANLRDDIEAALIQQFTPKLNIAKCKSSNKEITGYVSNHLKKTFRVVAALKNSSLSDAIAEAVNDWLSKPENKEIIKKHNLKPEE